MVGLRKGLWRLIQIARWAGKRKLKLRVQVVGPLEPEAPGLLVAAPPNVEWLGVRKGAALREILHQADLYCLPSYEEGFGISILEAMSTGLPALVSAETGGKEALRPGQNGLVLSGFTEDALDAELAPLLADKESRLEMGRCARKTVENAYAEQHYREQLIAEYRRMFQRAAEAGESLRSAWKAAPIS
jgi:glycosyltransferase involved in cell wall biosynthesis